MGHLGCLFMWPSWRRYIWSALIGIIGRLKSGYGIHLNNDKNDRKIPVLLLKCDKKVYYA